jgi:hypothetical protein
VVHLAAPDNTFQADMSRLDAFLPGRSYLAGPPNEHCPDRCAQVDMRGISRTARTPSRQAADSRSDATRIVGLTNNLGDLAVR